MLTEEKTLQPMGGAERLVHIDILRGMALLGVLLVNLIYFDGLSWLMDADLVYPLGWGGDTMESLLYLIFESKAIGLLSLLFGVGMAIQFDRASVKGLSFYSLEFRRISGLALFGVIHSFLIWNGDILLDYALIGLFILPVMRINHKWFLLLIPLVYVISQWIIKPFIPMMENFYSDSVAVNAIYANFYGNSPWWGAFKFRVWDFFNAFGFLRLYGRMSYCPTFFVLGVYFWKSGIISDPKSHKNLLRILTWTCFILGLTLVSFPESYIEKISYIYWMKNYLLVIGYLAGILLLVERPWWREKLGIFSPLGQMALTQYLLQSIICTFIFNGYGLGLYGKVPLNQLMLGGFVFFGVQVWSSHLWLSIFKMGPMEWVWRSMTYGTIQAFKKTINSEHQKPLLVEK